MKHGIHELAFRGREVMFASETIIYATMDLIWEYYISDSREKSDIAIKAQHGLMEHDFAA